MRNIITKPVTSIDMKDIVQEWYATYLASMKESELYAVLSAASYLHIKPLADLIGANIAVMTYASISAMTKRQTRGEKEMFGYYRGERSRSSIVGEPVGMIHD